MIDYSSIYKIMSANKMKFCVDAIALKNEKAIYKEYFDEFLYWKDIYNKLPEIDPENVDINLMSSIVSISSNKSLDNPEKFVELLKEYRPWRKGPFDVFGVNIQTEWRSDLKWDRLKNHISSLKNRLVLDVGCGSGYHCFRMKGAGAKLVIGIEPYFRFVAQFYMLQKYIKNPYIAVFPLKCEDMPNNIERFDTVFSMGILYHRTSPIDHLIQLKSFMRDGGELVLDTLIVDDGRDFLMPKDRYSKMRNVWFIPSVDVLKMWMERVGFKNIRCIDVTRTTTEEQNKTEWMRLESLSDFLDPNDKTKTVEGYPAPTRAIFVAEK